MISAAPRPEHGRTSRLTERPTFAVYAPFGTDAELSAFPDGSTATIAAHPLVQHLREVAATGANVLALIDRLGDDTWLVTLEAGEEVLESQGKLDMLAPSTVADFVALAHRRHPDSSLVLAIEGHGAGFLPELDLGELRRLAAAGDAPVEWRDHGDGVSRAYHRSGERAGQPLAHHGAPVLPAANPTLPGSNPSLPGGHAVLSTWALGEGLRRAAVPMLSVIHFNNCFNMAVEVLHTVAPHAEVATGYCNYNFFSAGQAYPAVFRRLRDAGHATALELGKWFAIENHRVLRAAGHEPTVAGTIALARLPEIARRVDELSDALLAALRGASAEERPEVVARIRRAIVAAQQYDSDGDDVLAAPDELTDLDSFAAALLKTDFGLPRVAAAADSLQAALAHVRQYGDDARPWMDADTRFDFSSRELAMSIFLPDPLLDGLWDWRSQYYLNVNPDPSRPRVQRHVIDFLKETDWVDFLLEYHRDTPLVGLRPARLPRTPLLHARDDPRRR